jgi:hypothetical protein
MKFLPQKREVKRLTRNDLLPPVGQSKRNSEITESDLQKLKGIPFDPHAYTNFSTIQR